MDKSAWVCIAGRWRFLVYLAALILEVTVGCFRLVDAQGIVPPVSLPPVSLPPGVSVPPLSSLAPPGLPSNITAGQLAKFSDAINGVTDEILKNFSFCVVKSDIEKTFDTLQNVNLLEKCLADVGETFLARICGVGEIELYFNRIVTTYKTLGVASNINCNPTQFSTACHAGFSGSLSPGADADQEDLKSTIIPQRTLDPQPCCDGFFCPVGLTCMIPCPIGASCARATFNAPNSTCDPYGYKPPPSSTVQCGGADAWLSYRNAPNTFCGGRSDGEFCPTTTSSGLLCRKGHFCRIGSVEEQRCNPLTKCTQEGLQKENIASAGILIIVILFVILLVIYNCSEQAINLRQRRRSKVRDSAAREARASVSAVERWKRAKEVALAARSKALKISGELSRTLRYRSRSRQFSVDLKNAELKHADETPLGTLESEEESVSDTFPENHVPPGSDVEHGEEIQELHLLSDPSAEGNRALRSDDLYRNNRPGSYDLYEAVRVPPVVLPDDDASSGKHSVTESESRKSRTSTARTRRDIYIYAYGQIEKEKFTQQAKPVSLNDVVESVGFRDLLEGKRRRQMELSFVDLSLMLKGSGKRILSNVTGVFSPSRVTAVMGPSGAGKTTFLNALAGKETGSRITGQVFINGQPGSMQSYKRIIGFVPQDDIVHGSLTVEENLTFSCMYRLPKNTPRQESVLVVERIIHELGLMGIRDSLVGTVEKRGISGGQRKRVNVGMELVIEPSLLILDEPTSGLDSTSSRLVMQALRREAALGANVNVVLHQPSYALFRMFDDVMFLARGGFTVYLGPVIELENYFLSLGFEMPDRVNPPDFVMDVLEGVVLPQNDPSFDITALPVLWMVHKGYNIPLHLQAKADISFVSTTWGGALDPHKSFFREYWDEFRISFLVRWEFLKASFARVKDLSGRSTPGFYPQFRVILKRITKQKFREPRLLAQDYIILLLAGICVGVLTNWKDTDLGGGSYNFTIIAVALLIMIASLRTFSGDKLQFWRESSSGINRVAFFLAKDTVDHFNTLIKPVVFLSMFYFFTNPRSTFASNYVVTLALVYCCTGIAYILAIILNPQPAQLGSVFLPVLATLLVTPPRTTGVLSIIGKISYAYWVLEAYTIANVKRYAGVWIISRCEVLKKSNYKLGDFNKCIGILIAYGAAARVLAFLCLVVFHRKQQK